MGQTGSWWAELAVAKTYQKALAQIGEIRPHHNSTAPAGWLLCDGSSQLRATYPDLFAAFCFTMTVSITSGSTTVSTLGVPFPAGNGAYVTIPTHLTGATVNSGQGATSIVLSSAPTATTTATMTVYPYGGSATHFNLPPFTGRVPKHQTYQGVKAGQGTVSVTSAHMASHNHGVYDPAHTHTITNGGSHNHGANGSSFAVWSGTISSASGTGGFYGVAYSINTADVGDTLTLTCGWNDTGFPATTGATGSASVDHNNIQPTLAVAYIVRAFV